MLHSQGCIERVQSLLKSFSSIQLIFCNNCPHIKVVAVSKTVLDMGLYCHACQPCYGNSRPVMLKSSIHHQHHHGAAAVDVWFTIHLSHPWPAFHNRYKYYVSMEINYSGYEKYSIPVVTRSSISEPFPNLLVHICNHKGLDVNYWCFSCTSFIFHSHKLERI